MTLYATPVPRMIIFSRESSSFRGAILPSLVNNAGPGLLPVQDYARAGEVEWADALCQKWVEWLGRIVWGANLWVMANYGEWSPNPSHLCCVC